MALGIAAMAALVLVLCAFYHSAEATDYTVGDTQQWDFGIDYTAWASTKSFHVGDALVFEYDNEMHNVLEVQKSAYVSCDTSNPVQEFDGGNNRILMSSAGTRYFICGVPGHCDAGMMVAVTVSAGSSSTPTPTPTPTTSPSPKSSNSGGDVSAGNFPFTPAAAAASPSPSSETAPPSTSIGHVSDIRNVLALLLASLIMSLILA